MFEYEKNCTLLIPTITGSSAPTSSELQKRLEDPSDSEKCKALRELIIWMTHGESYNRLLMTVIRYVVQSTNHKVKKYLQLYWEVVEKCNEDGSLKEEMILVCNALRNDLQHPNEYIRGSTLRLLCNLRFIKLIQPLIESILENLQHRHSYVRRNAVMCIYSIIKTFGVEIIPNAVDEVEKLLLIEGDVSTKRNAFLVLTHCDVERSLRYILSIQENVTYMGDVIQMVLLELLGKNYKDHPSYRNNLVQLIVNITQSGSPAVSFEGANTLIKIGNATPNSTIKIALQAYINLLLTHSDNNVRYIVLNKISKIANVTSALYVLQKCFVKDILRVLLCSNCYSLQIKVIEIMLSSLLTKNNCLDIFQLLLKHLQDISVQNQGKLANKNGDGEIAGGSVITGTECGNHSVGGIVGNNSTSIGLLNDKCCGNVDFNSSYQLFASGIDFSHGGGFGGLMAMTTALQGGGGGKLSEIQQFQNYQLVLIKSLHEITRRYHKITFKPMIDTMVTFLANPNPIVVHEITQFLREMIISYPEYQNEIVEKLIVYMPYIQFSRPLRTCLWILSECEYRDDKNKVVSIIDMIYSSLEPLPLKRGAAAKRASHDITGGNCDEEVFGICLNDDDNNKGGEEEGDIARIKVNYAAKSIKNTPNIITKTVILEDGTYSTQNMECYNASGLSDITGTSGTTVQFSSFNNVKEISKVPGIEGVPSIGKNNNLRALITRDEDLLLMASIGVSLVKLLCLSPSPTEPLLGGGEEGGNSVVDFGVSTYNKALYIIVCFLRYCLSDQKSGGVHNDTSHRLTHCYLLLKSMYEDLSQLGSEGEERRDGRSCLGRIRLSERSALLRRRLFPRPNGGAVGGGGELVGDGAARVALKQRESCDEGGGAVPRKQLPYNIVGFRQLKEKIFSNNVDITQINDDDGEFECIDSSSREEDGAGGFGRGVADHCSSKRIYPITGLSDPIYIEAILQVQHQDVLLELIVTNQSYKAVQNVQIELYPYGSLRVMEKPQSINHLDPGSTVHVYSIAQVKSIETGILFGFVTFQTKNPQSDGGQLPSLSAGAAAVSTGGVLSLSAASLSQQLLGLNDIVVLNEISIDLVDFITNSNIPSPLFRQLWSEFEWENKIPIHSSCDSFVQFLKYLMKETKLSLVGCNGFGDAKTAGATTAALAGGGGTAAVPHLPQVTGESPSHLVLMDESSSFFAANLYARSIFGEDALVNISLEKQQVVGGQKNAPERGEARATITGTVRIRSRTQGIALSLGDHIVSLQRRIPCEDFRRQHVATSDENARTGTAETGGKDDDFGKWSGVDGDHKNYCSRYSRLLNIDFGEIY